MTTVDGDKTYTAQWQVSQYDITYILDGGSHSGNPTKYTYGVGVTSFADATKAGFTFKGWYTAATDGNKIESISTTATGTQTLYAQWQVDSPAINVANTAPGSEFTFAGSQWRILDTDMDNDDTNGLQALVIKVDPISTSSKFLASGTRYFESTGISNGYERSRSIGGVGKVIDDWYKDNIVGTADEAAVQAIALNNPDFNAFSAGITFSSGSTTIDWRWTNYYQNTRFATTLDSSGSKQAFALSHGDIHGLWASEQLQRLLAF
ncbi:MAG: InlB B-repeat-containing protein [Pseudolactococcus laudensis]